MTPTNLETMDHFKATSNAVLLATDVAARGLDVKGIGAVVHYDLPRTADAFVHRRYCGPIMLVVLYMGS